MVRNYKSNRLRRGGKNTQNCTKKNLNDPDNHNGVFSSRARHPGV